MDKQTKKTNDVVYDFGKRYTVCDMIGSGGMGRTFKAFDNELGMYVAIKTINQDLQLKDKAVRRFKEEARLALSVAHHNVVRIHDLGITNDGINYISMEYIDGKSLDDIMKEGNPIGIDETIKIARQISDGLRAIHEKGIVHRDLKPHNIIIGENQTVYIVDFGLAKSFDDKSLTQSGALVGTPEYISPEQVYGKRADHRADIYALGVIMYKMVTGHNVFNSENEIGFLREHIKTIPELPTAYNSLVPAFLENIIMKCLRKKRNNRYQEAASILNDLDNKTYSENGKNGKQKKAKNSIVAGLIIIILALLAIFSSFSNRNYGGDKKKIVFDKSFMKVAILKPCNNSNEYWNQKLCDAFQSLTIEDLSQTNRFDVIPLKHMHDKSCCSSSHDKLKNIAVETKAPIVITTTISSTDKNGMIAIQCFCYDFNENKKTQILDRKIDDSKFIYGAVDELTIQIKKLYLTEEEIELETKEGRDRSIKEITTTNIDAYHSYLLGIGEYWENNYEKAISDFKRAINIDAKFARAYIDLGVIYLDLEKYDLAKENLMTAYGLIECMSGRDKGLVQAFIYDMLGERNVDDIYNKLIRIWPADCKIKMACGAYFRNNENWGKALEQFSDVIKLNPELWEAHANIIYINMVIGKYEKAKEIIESLKYKFNKNISFNYLMAHVFLYYKKFYKSIESMDKSINLRDVDRSEKKYLRLRWKGLCELLKDELDNSENFYKRAIDCNIGIRKFESMIELVSVYFTRGDYLKVEEYLKECIDVSRDSGMPLYELKFLLCLSYSYMKSGKFGESVAVSKKIINSKMVSCHDFLKIRRMALAISGLSYLSEKKINRAIEKLSELENMTPPKKIAKERFYYILAAEIMNQKGDSLTSAHYYSIAKNNSPYIFGEFEDRSFVVFGLAKTYYENHVYSHAETLYKEIQGYGFCRLFGDNYTLSYLYLGNIYFMKKDYDKAKYQYETFMKLWKGNEDKKSYTKERLIEIDKIKDRHSLSLSKE